MESDVNKNITISTSTPSWIDEQVAAERARLLEEAGLSSAPPRHFQRPVERPFTRQERDHVTILFGGFTLHHDRLIYAGLEGLGYNVDHIPMPTKTDFQTGKEYGNNGQCNPTYFTVGALVNYLKRLRDDKGIPTENIISDYVFVTGGACGACRFGTYEAEYRLALRNAGFDGFRVLLFQQSGELSQSGIDAGLEINLPFFLVLFNAIFIGDLLNAVAAHIRPYETTPGKTSEVLEKCLVVCQQALRTNNYDSVKRSTLAKLLSKVISASVDDAAMIINQLSGTHFIQAFAKCRQIIDDEIEVDYTRAKPVVKITGEFWAQTTEGDGNFNMFTFLEGEGAELLVEPITTFVDYTLNFFRTYYCDRRGLKEGTEPPRFWNLGKRFRSEADFRKKMLMFTLAHKILDREYERLRKALGGSVHPLADQIELERLGHPHYNSRADGGEGHLEVAKNIYYSNHDLAHMILSLKPFGCLPSTQSDGVQTAVTANYPDMIFLPIETSGEGDINAHSRVQMALGEAKLKCRDEFNAAVTRTAYTLENIRAYVAEHRELRRPLVNTPHTQGVISRAANFVLYVAKRMDQDKTWVARKPQSQPAKL